MLETIGLFLIYALLVFVIIFIGMALFNETLLFGFLLVDYSLKAMYKPNEYPPAPFTRYLKNFWLEFIFIMAKYPYLPLKWCNLTVNATSDSDTAILLVHGYCRNQTDWVWMRKQLKDLSHPIFCVNLEPMFGSIEDITTNSIVPKIAHIKQTTSAKKLILVGHSMGGLVSSYYSENLDPDEFVKTVISIGTPYSGTKIAVAGTGMNAKQMCPGSEFITALHHKIHNSMKDYYQISSRFDNKVFPWQSAVLEGTPGKQQYILPFAAHLCMLRNKDVANKLKMWIK